MSTTLVKYVNPFARCVLKTFHRFTHNSALSSSVSGIPSLFGLSIFHGSAYKHQETKSQERSSKLVMKRNFPTINSLGAHSTNNTLILGLYNLNIDKEHVPVKDISSQPAIIYDLPQFYDITEINIEEEKIQIDDQINSNNLPMQAGKSDLKWRRRAMRRHRLLRWRKKFPKLLKARVLKRTTKRKRLRNESLQKSYEMFGLTEVPPKLSPEEKTRLQNEWREEGIWIDALTVDEYKNYAKITAIMKRTERK